MYHIDKIYQNSTEIKKSKFISFAIPIYSFDEKDAVLRELRKKYNDATHVCYALVLNSPNYEKCSDDGEPEGTAGKPLLEVLRRNKLSNVLLVVVRYFGGVKLGAGGLLRAYSNAGNDVVKLCNLGESKILTKYRVVVDLNKGKAVLDYLTSENIKILNKIYSDKLVIDIAVSNDIQIPNCKMENLGQERVFYAKNK